MQFVAKVAFVVLCAVLPLIVLAGAGAMCMSQSAGTQIVGIAVLLSAGFALGVVGGLLASDRMRI